MILAALIGVSHGLIGQDGMPVALYEPKELEVQEVDSKVMTYASDKNRMPMVQSSPSSFGPNINVNPVSIFLNIFYYGQYVMPGILPIVFSITSYGRSLHCLVSTSFSVFFISEYLKTGFYPFLPFALNFSDYYPRLFSCLFLMIMEHLSVGAIAYHFSTIVWLPDGPAWREAYGFHKRATFSTIEIILGWDPSPYYAHVFVFSYATFKYFGYISLEYKFRKNAAGGRFPFLLALVKMKFLGLIISRVITIISGFVLTGLFIQFLYDIISTNEIILFFSIFFHMNSQASITATLIISAVMILIGLVSHLI